MKTVFDNINEMIVNKSKFITLFYQVDDLDDIDIILKNVKEKYKDATHYCYAYIIDSNIKASDDGEPSNTAGLPILNVLKKEQLNHVLCIVIRYFGGVKLGAGGLIRTYSNAAKNVLKIKILQKGFLIRISFDYSKSKEINYLLNDCIIINKDFLNSTTYDINITVDNFNKIKNKLEQLSEINIMKEIYM